MENINATDDDHLLGSFFPTDFDFLPNRNTSKFTFGNWLIDDNVSEGDEAFKLQLSLVDPPSQPNVVTGKQDTSVVVIKDNDPVT